MESSSAVRRAVFLTSRAAGGVWLTVDLKAFGVHDFSASREALSAGLRWDMTGPVKIRKVSSLGPSGQGLSSDKRDDEVALHRGLLAQLGHSSRVQATVRLLDAPSYKADVADTSSKSIVCQPDTGEQWAVLSVSSRAFPRAVAQEVRARREMARALETTLATPVLLPLTSGFLSGVSYALWPYCSPVVTTGIGSAARLWLLSVQVDRWLQAVAQVHHRLANPEMVERRYLEPLSYLASLASMPSDIRRLSADGRDRVLDGSLPAVLAPAHNDLWLGNTLHENRGRGGHSFTIIDWGASLVDGHPFVDLARWLGARRISASLLGFSLRTMAGNIGVSEQDILLVVLAGLGHLGLRRGEFPQHRYEALVKRQFRIVERALGR